LVLNRIKDTPEKKKAFFNHPFLWYMAAWSSGPNTYQATTTGSNSPSTQSYPSICKTLSNVPFSNQVLSQLRIV